MNNKTLAILILAGAGLLWWYQNQNQTTHTYTQQNPPPAPKGNLASDYSQWLVWAKLIFDLFKQLYPDIKAMWEPGGPFYNTPVPEPETNDGAIFWEDVSGLA